MLILGDKGDKGATGATGLSGDSAPAGPKGDIGPKGDVGKNAIEDEYIGEYVSGPRVFVCPTDMTVTFQRKTCIYVVSTINTLWICPLNIRVPRNCQ